MVTRGSSVGEARVRVSGDEATRQRGRLPFLYLINVLVFVERRRILTGPGSGAKQRRQAVAVPCRTGPPLKRLHAMPRLLGLPPSETRALCLSLHWTAAGSSPSPACCRCTRHGGFALSWPLGDKGDVACETIESSFLFLR